MNCQLWLHLYLMRMGFYDRIFQFIYTKILHLLKKENCDLRLKTGKRYGCITKQTSSFKPTSYNCLHTINYQYLLLTVNECVYVEICYRYGNYGINCFSFNHWRIVVDSCTFYPLHISRSNLWQHCEE
jgi:hypothetical protein